MSKTRPPLGAPVPPTLKEAADAVLLAARNLVDIQDATPRGTPYSIAWHNALNEAARVYTGLWWKRARPRPKPRRRGRA